MSTIARTARVALVTIFTALPASKALAQTVTPGSDTDSPMLLVLLAVFCGLVIGLLAHTAYRMARMN